MTNKTLSLRNGDFLSSIVSTDKEAYLEYLNEPAIRQFTDNIPYPYMGAHADWWISQRQQWTQQHKQEIYFAIRRPDAKLIGAVGIGDIDVGHTHLAELGYWLAKPYWGQGIVTEAVRVFIAYAFDQLSLQRLFARVFALNIGSWRVLEKNGFQLEGVLRHHVYRHGQYLDDRIYGFLRSEWLDQRSVFR